MDFGTSVTAGFGAAARERSIGSGSALRIGLGRVSSNTGGGDTAALSCGLDRRNAAAASTAAMARPAAIAMRPFEDEDAPARAGSGDAAADAACGDSMRSASGAVGRSSGSGRRHPAAISRNGRGAFPPPNIPEISSPAPYISSGAAPAAAVIEPAVSLMRSPTASTFSGRMSPCARELRPGALPRARRQRSCAQLGAAENLQRRRETCNAGHCWEWQVRSLSR